MSGPFVLDSMFELPRSMIDFGRLAIQWEEIARNAPQGQPHPVLVLPGFIAGDESTMMMRRLLSHIGYEALPWLQSRNTGHPRLLKGAIKRFEDIHNDFGVPVSIVGHSLGGVFSREIARQFPDAVRCVVTLASPYGKTDGGTNGPMVEKLFEQISGASVEELREVMPARRDQAPLQVPATSIYSKVDGVVEWEACIEPETEISESIAVCGSHSGMAMNPDVLRIVIDRLAQDPNRWSRYNDQKSCVLSLA